MATTNPALQYPTKVMDMTETNHPSNEQPNIYSGAHELNPKHTHNWCLNIFKQENKSFTPNIYLEIRIKIYLSTWIES